MRFLATYFFVAGMDSDDLAQEARLAAWLAPGNERVAARRRVLDLLKFSQRRPRFAAAIEDFRLVDARADVVELVEARERLRSVIAANLTQSERVAVGRRLRGEPIRRDEKVLDQAWFRARRKLAVAA